MPFERAPEVLAVARLATAEEARLEKLASGIGLPDFLKLPR